MNNGNDTPSKSLEPAPIIIGAVVFCFVLMAMIYIFYDWKIQLQKTKHQSGSSYDHNHNEVVLHLEHFPSGGSVGRGELLQEDINVTMERFLNNIARQRPFRFTPHHLASFTNNFSKVLGLGGFGMVYEGVFPNGVQIAVKVLHKIPNNRDAEQFMAEVGTIGRTYHINLVRLYGFCFSNNMRALLYEYMEFGSLDQLLFTNLKWSIDYETLYDIAIGTAKGIAYLHEECEKRIIHYDIKPENVLLDANMKPKVADFGLAMLCNQDNSHVILSSYRGTPGYASPEMWTPYAVTQKCDVYSFGMLLFEIVGRRRNHEPTLIGTSQEWFPKWMYEKFVMGELSEALMTCGIRKEEIELAKRTIMVALWCVQYLPKSRPIMSSVVKMLEGGVDIDTPSNPFEHLHDLLMELGSSNNSKATTSTLSINEGSVTSLIR